MIRRLRRLSPARSRQTDRQPPQQHIAERPGALLADVRLLPTRRGRAIVEHRLTHELDTLVVVRRASDT